VKIAYQIIILQLSFAVLAAFGWFLATDWLAALSAVAAGLGSIIPNILFAFQLFARPTQSGMAKHVLKRFYRGVVLKIGLTALFFWISIAYLHVVFLPFITTYLLCQLAFWLMPLVNKYQAAWLRNKNRVMSA
jgi:F0F1-type ATP synthase assembly protein I